MHSRNLVREYLQSLILNSMQRAGAMLCLAFYGGTCLRFVFGASRFSEDLDFALEIQQTKYDFRAYLHAIQKDLSAQGYIINLKVNDKKTVHSAFVGFQGLLYELGLSSQESEVFSIKLEVDTSPPDSAGLDISFIRKYSVLRLQHHDKSSLLAGKIHAILQRPFIKGRDLYDLFWYISNPAWPAPNITMLNNALIQTGWKNGLVTEENWRGIVLQRLQYINWNNIRKDLNPFVQSEDDIFNAISEESFRILLLG